MEKELYTKRISRVYTKINMILLKLNVVYRDKAEINFSAPNKLYPVIDVDQ